MSNKKKYEHVLDLLTEAEGVMYDEAEKENWSHPEDVWIAHHMINLAQTTMADLIEENEEEFDETPSEPLT